MMNFFYKSKKLRVRVAAIIQDDNGNILFIKQKKNKKDYWLLPGGGIEFGESAESALARELKEELELEIENPEFVCLSENIDPEGNRHLLQLVFKTKVKSGTPNIPKNETVVLDFKFFSLEELQTIEIRPDIKDFLKSNPKLEMNSIYLKTKWISDTK
ncbi:MAG: NUDIX hydrolase [Leptospiraceae bacterium]|nr:NUDIX hydrolase [Leptospiraceae bacterium]